MGKKIPPAPPPKPHTDDTPLAEHSPVLGEGVTLARVGSLFTIKQKNQPGANDEYFSLRKCSLTEASTKETQANAVDFGTNVIGGALAITGVGLLPGAVVGVAGKSLSEVLRDHCREPDEQLALGEAVKGTISTVLKAGMTIAVPSAGGLVQLAYNGATAGAGMASDKALDAVQMQLQLDQVSKPQEPYVHVKDGPQPFPKREATGNQQAGIQETSDALKKKIFCAGVAEDVCADRLGTLDVAQNLPASQKTPATLKKTGLY